MSEQHNYYLKGLETARKDIGGLAKSAAFFSKVEEWKGYKYAIDNALIHLDSLIEWDKRNEES